ncbi:hypothetical protein ACWDZ4_19285 [Streptomyces sp. NPDC003016]
MLSSTKRSPENNGIAAPSARRTPAAVGGSSTVSTADEVRSARRKDFHWSFASTTSPSPSSQEATTS